MTRKIALVALLLLLAGILPLPIRTCYAIPATAARTRLVAAIPDDLSPTFFRDPATGKPGGFAVAVLDEIARREGMDVEYIYGKPWDEIHQMLLDGRADIIPGVIETESRKKIFSLTTQFDAISVGLIARVTDRRTEFPAAGMKLGAIVGSGGERYFKLHPEITGIFYDSTKTMMYDLLSGQLDLVVAPIENFVRRAADAGLESKIHVVNPKVQEVRRVMALRQGDKELYARIDGAIGAFVKTPEYQNIYSKWHAKPKPFWNEGRIRTLLFAGGLLLVVMTLLIWRYAGTNTLNRKLWDALAELKAADKALAESEARYRTIVQTQSEFIARYLPGGILTFVNDTFCNYLGVSREELIGKSYYPSMREDYRQEFISQIEGLNLERPSFVAEGPVTLYDGRVAWHRWTHRAIFDESGRAVEYQASGADVTAQRQALEAQKDSEERLATAQRIAHIGSWERDISTGALYWSDEAHRICEIEKSDQPLTTEDYVRVIHPEDRDMLEKDYFESISDKRLHDVMNRLLMPDGRIKYVHSISETVYDTDGRPVKSIGTIHDITQQKMAEIALKKSENMLQAIIDAEPECVKLIDIDANLIFMNRAGLDMIEVESLDDVKGKCVCPIVTTECRDDFMALTRRVFSGESGTLTFGMVGFKGRRLVLETHAVPFRDETGRIIALLGVTRDVTSQKEAEQKIEQSLLEKEVLLREIHHRVKNNMAIISSLLKMQSAYVKDPEDKLMFMESQARIKSMALVHEKLYQAGDFANVDLDAYLSSLIKNIRMMFATKGNIITRIEANDVRLDIDVMIPCGLIINELVTNAFKYAFDGEGPYEVAVIFRKTLDGNISLTVADSGKGLPEGISLSNSDGLGLKLVDALCGQIKAEVSIDRSSGTAFHLTFPGSIKFAKIDE